jgi:hypothetical protein
MTVTESPGGWSCTAQSGVTVAAETARCVNPISKGTTPTMREVISTCWRRLAVALALTCAMSAVAAAGASAEEYNKEYEQALSLGTQAYVYGQPLLDMQRVFETTTSVTVPDSLGDAPVNQFSHFTELANTKEGTVVAPNADTLYSIAWLELHPDAMVLHVPASGRFNVVPLMTPYTENFANIGNGASGMLAPGNYLIAGPKRFVGVEEYKGLKVIHSPYNRVWIIQRTQVNSHEDLPNALAIQAATKIVPLERWPSEGLNYKPPAPETEIAKPTVATIPGTQAGEDPLAYWDALGAALQEFTPPAADQPLLEQLAAVDIGPGKYPSKDRHLSAGTLAGLRAAVAAGPGQVSKDLLELFHGGFEAHNGWLVPAVGNYGTNYVLRAVADKIGLGALPPNIAIYPVAQTERFGHPLNGLTTRYVAHFPASDFPVPVQAFWSLTMYEANGFFVANPLNRYTLGDRSSLHYNADGSLDVYLQTAEPTNAEQQGNWLPAPAGPFQMIMRLYGTDESAIPGILAGGPGHWTPPTILPCLESGKTAAGWNCAS